MSCTCSSSVSSSKTSKRQKDKGERELVSPFCIVFIVLFRSSFLCSHRKNKTKEKEDDAISKTRQWTFEKKRVSLFLCVKNFFTCHSQAHQRRREKGEESKKKGWNFQHYISKTWATGRKGEEFSLAGICWLGFLPSRPPCFYFTPFLPLNTGLT